MAAAHPAGFSGETQPTAGLLRALYLAYLLTLLYTPPFPTTLYATPKALFTQVPRKAFSEVLVDVLSCNIALVLPRK
jgi:hypothetical protein